MKSDEEKFLGYFRLLEKIVKKSSNYFKEENLSNILKNSKSYLIKRLDSSDKEVKSFIKRVEYLNRQKYNTEKCIGDFFDFLPTELSSHLAFNKSDLRKIVELRNNITHANDYIYDEEKMHEYTKFINALLFLALIKKLNIPLDTCIPVRRRIQRV